MEDGGVEPPQRPAKPTPPEAIVVWAPPWSVKLGDQVDVEKGTLTAPCLAGAEEVVSAPEAFFGSK